MAEETTAPTVEPRSGATATTATAKPTGAELPDELIQIPAMQALVAGAPPAFSDVLANFEKRPEAKIIAANKDPLMKAGFGLYRSLDGAQGVVFNQLFVSPDEIKAADQAGRLAELAPPFEELNATVAQSGPNNPVLSGGERPTGFKGGPGAAPAMPPMGSAPPPPASEQTALATKRANNMALGAPTTGPAPGAGRLLNSVLKPVI